MKNQYVGDINDYRKYGLLRILGPSAGLSTGICWMLTPDDGRTDGKFVDYLGDPDRWSKYDRELFHVLRTIVVHQQERHVSLVESSGALRGCRFFSDIVPRSRLDRERYLAECLQQFAGADLIFFDPDNGLEVKSVRFGASQSPKYLYWSEVVQAYSAGHSLLIYQHFPRVERARFTAETAEAFRNRTRCPWVASLATSRVVYFLVPQERHQMALRDELERVSRQWVGEFATTLYQ